MDHCEPAPLGLPLLLLSPTTPAMSSSSKDQTPAVKSKVRGGTAGAETERAALHGTARQLSQSYDESKANLTESSDSLTSGRPVRLVS